MVADPARGKPGSARGLPIHEETRPTRSRVVYASEYIRPSPSWRPAIPAHWVGKLMALQVGRGQFQPPVPPGASRRAAAQVAREVVARRVHDSDGHVTPRLLDREAQVAVVGDDQRAVYGTAEHIEQQMGGDRDQRLQVHVL